MALPPCGNRMPSHRIHTYCVCSPTDFHSSGGILPPPQQRVSHRIRRSHRSLCWEYSPTDFTDLHRWLGCGRFSHRFHRIHRTSCWVYSPTDFTDLHRWLGCLQGGALVSSAPTKKCTNQEVHQPRSTPTEHMNAVCFVGAAETAAPPGG